MLSPDSIRNELTTKTYTAPSGTVVVVRDVPARLIKRPDRSDRISYSIDVAEKLDELINLALAGATPEDVKVINFAETPTKPHADYELEFVGPEASFVDASLQVWRLVFDKAYTALKTAVRAVSLERGKGISVGLIPRLAYVGPSSIVLGIKTSSQTYFPILEADPDDRDRAVQLLISTAEWISGNLEALPETIVNNAAALDSLLRAVEELSPASESVNLVRIKSRDGDRRTANLSRNTREAAKKRRIDIRIASSGEERLIELSGLLSQIDVRGTIVVKDISANTSWRKSTALCRYSVDLRASLLENFAKTVRLSVIQKRIGQEWAEADLEVVDVIRENSIASE
jgi:hypothetical protein